MSEEYDFDHEPIEGYCMSCRMSVEIDAPRPVWTRKGQPATRGSCPQCGGTVFRMGKTEQHSEANRPDPVEIGDGDKRTRPKLQRDTVYLNYAAADEAIAQRLADDLQKSGIVVWLHEDSDGDTNWSSGVHPALKECKQMVYVLSQAGLDDETVTTAWQFFRDQRKPIVIAQTASVPPPDRIRRSPRFDIAADYKSSLRQMVRTIGEA